MADHCTTLIGGTWQDPETRTEITNPVDDSVVGTIGCGSAQEALAAADAAAAAFPGWADTPARYRADLLRVAGEALADRADELGALLAREAGKRLPEGVAEVRFAAEYFRWFAEEIRRPSGTVYQHEVQERRHLSIRRPSGVVVSLTPWNFPVSIQARKLAPALASGCTVVARPSEKAPLAVVEMLRCLHEAGIPSGVINLVHGPAGDLTEALLAHPAARVISFTGSTEVGKHVMRLASNRIVRPLLELGGNAPFLVFNDADLDAAIDGALVAKFRNTGQSCIAANRFLVQDEIYDEFVSRLTDRIDAMIVGDGLAEPTPDLSAVIDETRADMVNSLIHEALVAGAHKVTRDFDLPTKGSFAAPTLLTDIPDGVAMGHVEVFGPAAGVFRFRTEAEALRRANDTELGLAAYLYTSSGDRAWRLGEHLEAGIVAVNNPLPSVAFAPMGGVKHSGLGREGGDLGLAEFEDVRYLTLGLAFDETHTR